jgi:Raf kinase inhibitor-like YbhB/YbcL family protein
MIATTAAWMGCDSGVSSMGMTLTSQAFTDGGTIPINHTGDGEDQSPPLTWDKVPEAARALALICDDPDAPGGTPWVHWVIYNIPTTTHSLPAGVPRDRELNDPSGTLQGINSWETVGYRGPSPPKKHGPHHYRFRLYALAVPVNLKPAADKAALLAAIKGHVLAETQLTGVYERK